MGITLPPEPKPPKEYMDPPRGRGLVPPPLPERLPFYAENIHFSNMEVVSDTVPVSLTIGDTERVDFIRNISFSHCRFKSAAPPYTHCRRMDNVNDWSFNDVTFEISASSKGGTDSGSRTVKPDDFFSNVANFEFENVRFKFAE